MPATAKKARNRPSEIDKARFESVMAAARRLGLLRDKSDRIGVQVSPRLVAEAKRLTGIESDTDLIEFALACLALESNFVEVFEDIRGTVDSNLKLEY
ncbi:hypothetical protein [Inquilinus sp. CA228]|uniref:hypothetical protein n=1 Tax=Inquilinus sp. CA228 TaxID=3455609 RepID=UPI003F8D6DA4